MVPRLAGASLGLLAFAISILAGLFAGNPAPAVLSRAILSLFAFFVVGLVLGAAAQRVLMDRYQRREQELVRQYQSSAEEGVSTSADPEGPEHRAAESGVTA